MTLAEQAGNPWLALVLAGAASIIIVLIGLGFRGRPRGSRMDGPLQQTVAELDELTRKLEVLLEEADTKIEQLRTLTAANPIDVPEQPADPVVRRVYELSDAGRAPAEIARELDEHIGKVELILALRQAGA
jgi:hypothetical protein